jgi:hypothetical protein
MINRALACSSALALCFTAAAALADDGKGGYSLVGSIAAFVGTGSDNASILGGDARFMVPLTDRGRCDPAMVRCPPVIASQFWSFQGDTSFQSYKWEFSDEWNFAGLTGHLTYNSQAYQLIPIPGSQPPRNQFNVLPSWRIGGYLGVLDAEWDTRLIHGGLEGQAYLGNNLQVEGRAGFHFGEDETLAHAFAAARYFINRNFYLEANALAASFSWGDHAVSVGLRGEYKFDRSPFAVFAGLNLDTHSGGWSFHEARAGVRVLYGERSLIGDMVKGASLGRDLLRPVFLAD